MYACIDDKEVLIHTDLEARLFEKTVLWSDNPVLVNLALNHFEMLWNIAVDKSAPTVPENRKGS